MEGSLGKGCNGGEPLVEEARRCNGGELIPFGVPLCVHIYDNPPKHIMFANAVMGLKVLLGPYHQTRGWFLMLNW